MQDCQEKTCDALRQGERKKFMCADCSVGVLKISQVILKCFPFSA